MGNAIRTVAKAAGVIILGKAVYTVGKQVGIVKAVCKMEKDPQLAEACREPAAAINNVLDCIKEGKKFDVDMKITPRAEETTVEEEATDQPED